ncbi:hypothetical protein TrVFT333_008764 [Trichoderma virens FT-333]|nr:hypothetical protein TrVFT333_008764 [Trichoderma virens FT-333]
MAEHNIVVFAGDHCGPEVIAEAIKVIKTVEELSPTAGKFNLQEHLLGGALAAAKAADAVLLGAIGGPKWGTGAVRPEQGLLKLRKIERIARLGGYLARTRGDSRVISLDKANVLATSRLWRQVVEEVYKNEFPDLKIEHQLIDSAAMIMVKNPTQLNGVILAPNLAGDILSDEASAIAGSIGLLPSASLCGIPGSGSSSAVRSIYEPIHGSAPDISGKGIVNPIGTILSVAMMFRYSLNLAHEAKVVEDAVRAAIDAGLRTKDMGGSTGTAEAGDAIVAELVKILKATGLLAPGMGRTVLPTNMLWDQRNVDFNPVKINFSGKVVFENLDLEFPAGKTIAIVGPSGIGKSMLLYWVRTL